MNNRWLIECDIFNQGIHAFCWMLLHSLWQGLILTMLAGLVMSFTRKAAANVRYNLLVSIMAAFLVTTAITFTYEWQAFGNDSQWSNTNRWSLASTTHRQWLTAIATYCSEHTIGLLTIWWMLFCFKCWQLGRGVLYLRHIRKGAAHLPTPEWQVRMAIFTEKLQLRRSVQLLESGLTKVPVVIGHFKPVIYMPLGLLTRLPAAQLEAVLLHELAHIHRHDYLINFVQHLAEAIFCCNPGFLWVSALLKQEREHCCDDLALQHTGKKKPLIQALVSFKEYAMYGATLTPAFPGQKQHLVQRAARLLQGSNTPLNTRERAFCFISMLTIALLLGALGTKKIFSTDNARQPLARVATTHLLSTSDADTQLKIHSRSNMHYQNPPEQKQQHKKMAQHEKPSQPSPKQTHKHKTITIDKQPVQKEAKEQAQMNIPEMAGNIHNPEAQVHYDKLKEAADRMRQQADRDRIQAEQHRQQAELDRQQADRDRIQADKDRKRADLDRQQAEKDRIRAEKDRAQAERDRARAERDRILAMQDRLSY
ncbi:M48 family metalloprotease [Chitinophaga pendula]|uniref:M56 family metallopeptidase n=1 Tax=Chitinophaga TaxID=79328 RepID=UPI000BAE8CC2|nr:MULTISPECIES: M56 family metallopeptidase [Chitinophaga]ASZ13843.1 hypothetical protein CK934_24260 [Chitinophaga sp. MD30]UCJ08534.1 M48 family metalloprotease [Chitinophaga pendula]